MHDQFSESSVSVFHAFSNIVVLAKVQAATCNLPHQNRATELIVIAAVIFAVASVFITLRLVSRVWVTGIIGHDDWIIAVALVRIGHIEADIFTSH